MTAINPGRPAEGEYLPYYEPYIRRVPDGDIVAIIRASDRGDGRVLRALQPGAGAMAPRAEGMERDRDRRASGR